MRFTSVLLHYIWLELQHMHDLGDLDWLSLTLLLPSVFAVFSRLDSFYPTSTQRILYVSRLFLVSLVPWIDKPWGNTLREKLHDPVRLRYINWGAKERQQGCSSGSRVTMANCSWCFGGSPPRATRARAGCIQPCSTCIPGGTNNIGLQGKLAILNGTSASSVDKGDDGGDCRQL